MLDLTDEELAGWKRIADRMRVPFLDGGIIAQFEGYDRLEELDWDAYRARYGDIQRLDRILEAEGDTINRYKASKQADVLMLFYLFSSRRAARPARLDGLRVRSGRRSRRPSTTTCAGLRTARR